MKMLYAIFLLSSMLYFQACVGSTSSGGSRKLNIETFPAGENKWNVSFLPNTESFNTHILIPKDGNPWVVKAESDLPFNFCFGQSCFYDAKSKKIGNKYVIHVKVEKAGGSDIWVSAANPPSRQSVAIRLYVKGA